MQNNLRQLLYLTQPLAIAFLVLNISTVTFCAEEIPFEAPKNKIEIQEENPYLAPGLQLGSNTQELSLTLGRVTLMTPEKTEGHLSKDGQSHAVGVRANLLAYNGVPTGASGLFFFSEGGWSWEWWPMAIEFGAGFGGYSGNTVGIGEISYIAGITGRLEIFTSGQFPISTPNVPQWFPTAVGGLRWGFSLGKHDKYKVTTEEQL